MRLSITKNKNSSSIYIIKSVTVNGKRTSKVIEKLGTLEEIKLKSNGKDPYVWAKEYLDLLNKEEKENSNDVIIRLSQIKSLDKNKQVTFNGGYLFLQKVYYNLKLNEICNSITNKYQFKFDLNCILSNLIYSRIIFPSSKLKTLEEAKNIMSNYYKMIEEQEYDKKMLGEAIVYDDIYKQPARKSCSTIFLRGMEKIVNGAK